MREVRTTSMRQIPSAIALEKLKRAGEIPKYAAPERVIDEHGCTAYVYKSTDTYEGARPVWA